MKWINAEQIVTVEILDEEREEYISKAMSVEDMLDAYTAEGCPSIYSQPTAERRGKWRHYEGMLYCSKCGAEFYDGIMEYCGDDVPKFCPNCGSAMESEK